MEKQVTEKTKEVHKLYAECKKVFEPSTTLFGEIVNIEDEAEKEFFYILCNFFLQQGRKETIAKGGLIE